MKRMYLLVFLALAGLYAVSAQSNIPHIEIDDNKLNRDITAEVERTLTGHPEWSLSSLLTQCTEQAPANIGAAINGLTANTTPLTSEETYSQCSDAILLFCRYYDCGHCDQMHAGVNASATVLSPDGICLTNYHVMENIIRDDKEGLKGDSLYFAATRDGKCYPITHILAYSEASDAAIFKVDTRGEELAYLPLGEPSLTGSEVRVISHPRGTLYYYSEGIVSRNMTATHRDGVERRRMQISADFAAGSSGAAIMDKCGNLVGMVESTNSVYYNPENQANLQMVFKNTIPVSDIRSLLGI